jgi:hypothetical protein
MAAWLASCEAEVARDYIFHDLYLRLCKIRSIKNDGGKFSSRQSVKLALDGFQICPTKRFCVLVKGLICFLCH